MLMQLILDFMEQVGHDDSMRVQVHEKSDMTRLQMQCSKIRNEKKNVLICLSTGHDMRYTASMLKQKTRYGLLLHTSSRPYSIEARAKPSITQCAMLEDQLDQSGTQNR